MTKSFSKKAWLLTALLAACGPGAGELGGTTDLEDEVGETIEAELTGAEVAQAEAFEEEVEVEASGAEPEDDAFFATNSSPELEALIGEPPLTPEQIAGTESDTPEEPPVEGELGTSEGSLTALPRFQVAFNDPHGNDAARMAVETALIRLIDKAPRGSAIRASWYNFTRQRPADALLRAEARGVNVSLVLDKNGAAGSAAAPLEKLKGFKTRCRKVGAKDAHGQACIGSNINHNKYALFSSLSDGSRNVVWQASANLTGGSMHQNGVIFRQNKKLYDTYVSYHGDLLKNPTKANLNYNRTESVGGAVKLYFSPQSKVDPVHNALRNISCNASGPKNTIRVAMAFITGSRGVRLAKELGKLRKEGCAIEVLMSDSKSKDRIATDVRKELLKGGVGARNYQMDSGHDGIHSKYMLVDARYGSSKRRQQLVFTGSHNWQNTAMMKNDEVLARISSTAVYNVYNADFMRIRKHTTALE